MIVALVDRVTRRMRASGRAGRTVLLRLRFADYSRATRSQTLPHATAATMEILTTVRRLRAAAEPTIDRQGLTLIGVAVANLDPEGTGIQLELPFDGPSRNALDAVLDDVRKRFGPTAVTRATLLDRKASLSPWLFPDEEPEL